MSESYQKFDFSKNQSWQNYLDQLYPPPAMNQIEKFKRKWYKKNIDQSFDIEFDSNRQSEPNQNSHNPQQSQNQSSHQSQSSTRTNDMPWWIDQVYTVEGYLKLFFYLSFLLFDSYKNIVIIVVCLLALLRQCKIPQFNKEYAKKILLNEFFHNIMFMVPLIIIPELQMFCFYIPIALHFALGLSEFISKKHTSVYLKFQQYIDTVRLNKNTIIYNKAKLEVNLLFLIILFTVLGNINIFSILIYSNFIRMKYMVNQNTQAAFRDIDLYVNQNIEPYLPSILKTVLTKIKQLCCYLVSY